MTECLKRYDDILCSYLDAQIESEGGYNPTRWAEFASEQYCSWGMWQNYICDDYGWSIGDARYVYNVLNFPENYSKKEYDRLVKFNYLFSLEWQTKEILDRYEYRIKRTEKFKFKDYHYKGRIVHKNIVAAIRLHNFNGGWDYLNRIISKHIQIYGN